MTSRINVPSNRLHPQAQAQPPYQSTYQPNTSTHHIRKQSSISGLASTIGIDNQQLNSVRQITSRVEDVIERFTQPLKPYLPAAARSVSSSFSGKRREIERK